MYLYIALLSLFILVLVLEAVEQRKAYKKRKRIQQSWKEWRDIQTALEQNKDRLYISIDLAMKTKDHTPEQPNTTQPETYEEYLKNGGTDNPLTWLYGTTDKNLFP